MSAISGVLIELAAIGNQDSYLNIRPRLTLFRGSYRRITNFAWTPILETLSNVTQNSVASVDLPRAGDLVAQMYVRMLIPSLTVGTYDNGAAFGMVRNATLEIGGYPFDSQTGRFMYMWNQLSTSDAKKLGQTVLQGSANELTLWSQCSGANGFANMAAGQHMYVPLSFWFNRFYAQALPMIALQYHAVKLSLDLNALAEVRSVGAAQRPSTFSADVLINYVFLDTVERRLFAATPHEYLIDQVHSPDGTNGLHTNQASLTYQPVMNHPVKELLWAFQVPGTAQVHRPVNDFAGNVNNAPGGTNDTFASMAMMLNGNERVNRNAAYYREVVPREVHTSAPYKPLEVAGIVGAAGSVMRESDQIYNYSFSVDPEDWKPSGSCNFSRIDTVTLKFNGLSPSTMQLYFYYRNFNVMKIVAGMAGLRYAN